MRSGVVLLSFMVTASTLSGCAASTSTPAFDPVACGQVFQIVAAMDGELTAANDADTNAEIDAHLDNAADAAGQLLNVQASPDFSELVETVYEAFQTEVESLREGFHGNNAAITDDWEDERAKALTPVAEVCVE